MGFHQSISVLRHRGQVLKRHIREAIPFLRISELISKGIGRANLPDGSTAVGFPTNLPADLINVLAKRGHPRINITDRSLKTFHRISDLRLKRLSRTRLT